MRIPRERMNYATGLYNLARNIGGSSGIAATTTILARRASITSRCWFPT
jgi:DHA2 family multidrug resistance protein